MKKILKRLLISALILMQTSVALPSYASEIDAFDNYTLLNFEDGTLGDVKADIGEVSHTKEGYNSAGAMKLEGTAYGEGLGFYLPGSYFTGDTKYTVSFLMKPTNEDMKPVQGWPGVHAVATCYGGNYIYQSEVISIDDGWYKVVFNDINFATVTDESGAVTNSFDENGRFFMRMGAYDNGDEDRSKWPPIGDYPIYIDDFTIKPVIEAEETETNSYSHRFNMDNSNHNFTSNGYCTLTHTANGGYNGTGGIDVDVHTSNADLFVNESYTVEAGVPYVLSVKVKPTGTTTPEMFLDGTQDVFEFFFQVGQDNWQYLNSHNATYDELEDGWYRMNYEYTYPTQDTAGNTVTEWTLGNHVIMRYWLNPDYDQNLTFTLDDLEIVTQEEFAASKAYAYDWNLNDSSTGNVTWWVNSANKEVCTEGGYSNSGCWQITADESSPYNAEICAYNVPLNTHVDYTFSFKVKPMNDSTIDKIINGRNLIIHGGFNYGEYAYNYKALDDGWYLCEAEKVRCESSDTPDTTKFLSGAIILYRGASKEDFLLDDIKITPVYPAITGVPLVGETISLDLSGNKYYWYELCASADGINWGVLECGTTNGVISYKLIEENANKYLKVVTIAEDGKIKEYAIDGKAAGLTLSLPSEWSSNITPLVTTNIGAIDSDNTYMVVLGMYKDENSFLGANVWTYALATDSLTTDSANTEIDSEATYVRAYLFNSHENVKPLADFVQLNNE